MKILNVHSQLTHHGGAEILLANLTREFVSMGHETAVLSSFCDAAGRAHFLPEVRLLQPECAKRPGDAGRNAFGALRLIPQILALRTAYKKIQKNYDVTIIHNFPAPWACAFIQKKAIWMCNEPPMLYSNPSPGTALKTIVAAGCFLDGIVVRNSAYHCVVSDAFNARRFEARYGIRPAINNYGVDYDFFASPPQENARQRWKISPDATLFVQVGIFSPQKNQKDSVAMLARFREHGHDGALILAGNDEGMYAKDIRRAVRDAGLERYVRITGNVTQAEVKDLYHAADFVIFPTRSQGSWLSPFEALAAGADIIVTTDFTAADIIRENTLGVVTEDFIAETADIARHGHSVQTLVARRQDWVRKHLSWRRFAELFVEIAKNSGHNGRLAANKRQ